jgi:hypothetical protein
MDAPLPKTAESRFVNPAAPDPVHPLPVTRQMPENCTADSAPDRAALFQPISQDDPRFSYYRPATSTNPDPVVPVRKVDDGRDYHRPTNSKPRGPKSPLEAARKK